MISTLFSPSKWFSDLFGAGDGIVTQSNLIGMPAVWYALQKISGDVGKMPLEPRITLPDGKGSNPYKSHITWSLLRDQPNDYQTPDVFKELIQLHALSWGNGRAAIIRNGTKPVELIPLMPDRTDTLMVEGQKYHVTMPYENDALRFRNYREELLETAEIRSEMIVLHDRDVLHIPGLGFDGVQGLSISKVFQEALGISHSGQRLMRKQMQKGFTGRVMLKDSGGAFQGQDAEKQATKFLEQFRERFTAEKDGEVAGMLRRGMEADVLSMSNADAQLIEQMQFSRQDVMLIFGLPHIPGDSTATSYNSLEQQQLQYLASCLDRWLTRWELQCDMKLRTEGEKQSDRIYFKFKTATWLKTDAQTTANVLATHIRSTVLSPNEAREILDRNPREGGDEFMNPAIATNEPNETRSDQARNKLRELIGVESKRVVELANKKSLKDATDAIASFYERWLLTIKNAMRDYDFDADAFLLSHTNQITDAILESKTVSEFRSKVQKITSEWSPDDVF